MDVLFGAREATTGSRLRMIIEDHNLTMAEVAETIGCSRDKIEHICDDKVIMSPEEMLKVAKAVGTSVNYLNLTSNSDLPEEYAQWTRKASLCTK